MAKIILICIENIIHAQRNDQLLFHELSVDTWFNAPKVLNS
jgi:hypothetical protein